MSPDGSDSWAKKLNLNGEGHTSTDFTDATLGTSSTNIIGRVCPPNVYIDDSNRRETGHCLYYSKQYASQGLDEDGTSQTSDGSIGLGSATNYQNGEERWYMGNVQTCANTGMRLPTIFETDTYKTSWSYYVDDDGSPSFAGTDGVPKANTDMWTASRIVTGSYSNNYVFLLSSGWVNGTSGGSNKAIRCVLPSGD